MTTMTQEPIDLTEQVNAAPDVYPVPVLAAAKNALVDAPDLTELAESLEMVSDGEVRWYWKNSEGGDFEHPKLGGIALVPPLFRESFGANYVAWISAPWVIAFEMTRQQVEAEVFHLLCHVADDENDQPIIQKPTIIAFPGELARYGAWSTALKDGAARLREHQMSLPGLEG